MDGVDINNTQNISEKKIYKSIQTTNNINDRELKIKPGIFSCCIVPGSSSRIILLFAAADCVEDGEASQLGHPPYITPGHHSLLIVTFMTPRHS